MVMVLYASDTEHLCFGLLLIEIQAHPVQLVTSLSQSLVCLDFHLCALLELLVPVKTQSLTLAHECFLDLVWF